MHVALNSTLGRLAVVAASLMLAVAVVTVAAQAGAAGDAPPPANAADQRTDGDATNGDLPGVAGALAPGSEGRQPAGGLYDDGEDASQPADLPKDAPAHLTPEERERLEAGYGNTSSGGTKDEPNPGSPRPPAGSPPDAPQPDYETVEGRPNIDAVEVVSRDSYPPQWSVTVVSGGYTSCVSHLEDRVAREGNEVHIEIVSLEPAPGVAVPCTRIYGSHTSYIDLEGEFEQGVEYVVFVNGERQATFAW